MLCPWNPETRNYTTESQAAKRLKRPPALGPREKREEGPPQGRVQGPRLLGKEPRSAHQEAAFLPPSSPSLLETRHAAPRGCGAHPKQLPADSSVFPECLSEN